MIKLCLWPWIEFFSSRGQESWHLAWFKNNLHLEGSSRILQDKVRMLGTLALCSPREHVFCCTLLTLQCAHVNEWNTLREASEEPCSAVPPQPHMAYGRNMLGVYTDLPKRHPMSPLGTNQKWAKRVDRTLFSRSNFSIFLTISKLLGIRRTNPICWIVDFQGTCDLCCYCILWLRSQTWISSQEAPSFARHGKFGR